MNVSAAQLLETLKLAHQHLDCPSLDEGYEPRSMFDSVECFNRCLAARRRVESVIADAEKDGVEC